MGIRDEEIQRLTNYIKGLGLTVSFSSKKSDCSASWYLDNSRIVIYKRNNSTKIETVLSLIHELGHAKHCIHKKDRKVDTQFESALEHVDEAEEQDIDSKKRQRKIILNNERAATEYWEEIYKETNMKFPIWRLWYSMEYDVWRYEYFYENGYDPDKEIRLDKEKELRRKYRG